MYLSPWKSLQEEHQRTTYIFRRIVLVLYMGTLWMAMVFGDEGATKLVKAPLSDEKEEEKEKENVSKIRNALQKLLERNQWDADKAALTLIHRDSFIDHRNAFSLSFSTVRGDLASYLCGSFIGPVLKDGIETCENVRLKMIGSGVDSRRSLWDACSLMHEETSKMMAEIVGCKESEVQMGIPMSVAATTILSDFYAPTSKKHMIAFDEPLSSELMCDVSEGHVFIDVCQEFVKYHRGLVSESLLMLSPRSNDIFVSTNDILRILEEEQSSLSIVVLHLVQGSSGYVIDIERIVSFCRAIGCVIGLDVTHAVGNIPMHLHDWDVDFAFWGISGLLSGSVVDEVCLFVHDHFPKPSASREPEFLPHLRFSRRRGAMPKGALTQPFVHSMLKLMCEVTIEKINKNGIVLAVFLEELLLKKLGDTVRILTPKTGGMCRGCQLSIEINGYSWTRTQELCQRLHAKGIFVTPIKQRRLHLSLFPLYVNHQDVSYFVECLLEEMS
eukprot:TRINITY_DN1267_c0_g2_i3.p1 TRINITY_DN1267_c0_g2~~TRINITY_DN1267_c0_g2_i3.p1  ORF type:complete len:499 (+),score=129.34 TRINITY_DN1267_c0_g2_i3:117-1613(+)